ncbi:MAG: hypothetical protein OXQ31_08305 [Spirochaetaceae bacterium]|nr:hypothetical protein [Spirochaetaceae bacterium]
MSEANLTRRVSSESVSALLTVENGNWGATSLRSIHAVLASAAEVQADAFGRAPDAPIQVAPWSRDPRVFDDQRPYQVRLIARDRYWSQYVYQFSHEFCHVMTNFDRHKGHKHRWFDESLCELASLFVLHRLAELWKAQPPAAIPDAAGFAFNHHTYAERTAARYPRISRDRLPEWLAGNLPRLEANPYERDLCGTVAVALLDSFHADPALWRDCAHLNHWDPNADSAFAEYLSSWTAHLQEQSLPFRAPVAIADLFKMVVDGRRAVRRRYASETPCYW